jgi:NADH:ubiquinone oxidoreductase subunit
MKDTVLKIDGGTGVTSCLTVRLAWAAHNKGILDSSNQFWMYKDKPEENVSKELLALKNYPRKSFDFDFNCQYLWYDDKKITSIYKTANEVCELSNIVYKKSCESSVILGDRTAVLYRGNDKALETPATDYDWMFRMAKESGSDSFYVQTDESEFYEQFKKYFPNTVRWEEIPMINKDLTKFVLPPVGERMQFAINFLASLLSMSQAKKVITTTGNTGLWLALFRESTENFWQVNSFQGSFRKLK